MPASTLEGTDPGKDGDAMAYYSPLDSLVTDDPYPYYKALREEQPVYYNEKDDFWALSRYDDVAGALHDPLSFSARKGTVYEDQTLEELPVPMMAFLDPPDHTRMRTMVSGSFVPKAVAGFKVAFGRNFVAQFDRLPGAELDVCQDLLLPWAIENDLELLEIPAESRPLWREWLNACFQRKRGNISFTAAGEEAIGHIMTFLAEEHLPRLYATEGTFLSRLINGSADGDRMSEVEALGFLFLMALAGPEDVARTAGYVLANVSAQPSVVELVRNDEPTRMNAIDETIRRDASTQYMRRTTAWDVDIRDTVIPEGARVLLLFGAANRDPEIFSDPDTFDIDRRNSRLAMGFSRGIHSCLGIHVSRLQMVAGLGEFFNRVESAELDLDAAESVHAMNITGFQRLPARLKLR
ncbi:MULTISPECIES: cytochrome P450 [Protofrankia]|nr:MULTISPECIES: cytochrome P450 [Protofrankia]